MIASVSGNHRVGIHTANRDTGLTENRCSTCQVFSGCPKVEGQFHIHGGDRDCSKHFSGFQPLKGRLFVTPGIRQFRLLVRIDLSVVSLKTL